jgi:hypothetical protein
VRASGGGSVRRDGVARDVTRVVRVDPVEFRLARFETVFLEIFELKSSKR